MEQAWSTVQASSQEITNQQVKRQRLEFSQQKAPLPHLSLSTIPPLGPMTTRAHSLPPLGTILRDQFSTPTVAQSIVAGRLKYFTHNWHKISESDWIRKTVAGYEIQLMYQPPVSHKPPKNWSSMLSQPASEELTKLLNKGVLVLADPCTPGFYSHIFTIPKKSGEQRLIINLKNLNRYIPHVHFKMEGLVQLQDMLLPHDWMTTSTRLDDEGGSKRSLLLCANPPQLSRSSEDMVEQQALQVRMPPFRTFQCTADVYEASKTSSGLPSRERNPSDNIHRRHSPHGGHGTKSDLRSFTDSGRVRVHGLPSELREVCFDSISKDRIFGIPSEFSRHVHSTTTGENSKNLRADSVTSSQSDALGQRDCQSCRDSQLVHPGCYAGSTSLPCSSSHEEPSNSNGRLRPPNISPSRSESRATLVVPTPHISQWETNKESSTRPDPVYRCLPPRVGSNLSRSPDRRCLVHGGTQPTYQLSRIARSLECSPVLLPREDKPCGSDMDGQYKCDILHQPYGRNTFISAGSDSSAILDMGPPEGDHAQSKTHSRGGECHSGQDVTNDCQRPVRLAVKSNNLLEDSSSLGSISCRHVCNKTVDPSPSILLIETRTPSRSYGCFSSGLVYSPGIRTPTLVSHTTLPEEGSDPGSNVGHGHSPLVNSELVPVNSVPLHRLSQTDPTSSRSDTAHGQHRSSKSKSAHSTGRLAYLGKSLRERGVSAEAQELMLSAWRSSTNKNYDSAWRKWEDFCNDRDINPFSASIESILSFLASQFHKGHQYRSLNIYRSAISSIHPRIDGFEIGKHPMVTRLMKGVFNKRPPLPKYTTTWSVGDVLRYLRSLGCSSDLSLKDLSYKLATLLALVTAGRSSDLVLLSVNHSTSTREGIKFVLNGLSKQSRPNHTRPPILVQKYIEDPLICPIECFNTYVSRTNQFRSVDGQGLFVPAQLFLGISKPHAPIKACSIARWIKCTLSSAGIDTKKFSAHSTRGATTSKAVEGGATLTEVLQQADWSTARTFHGFYFRPSQVSSFSSAVLSSARTSKLHADIEPEHSEV